MIAVLICLLVMLALHILTPYWWWVMIVPFAYGAAAARSGGKALRTGFFSAGLLWLGGSIYFFMTGSRIIAERMARMFGLGRSWLMILATALIAAVAAAVAGYAGYTIRALYRRTPGKGAGAQEKTETQMDKNAWVKEFPGAVTVCDKEGRIIEMNEKSAEAFAGDGGAKLIGANVLDCHPEPSRTKLKEMMEAGRTNVYTIQKKGKKKLIYQSPWYVEGRYAGFVELSVEIPWDMPHFNRD